MYLDDELTYALFSLDYFDAFWNRYWNDRINQNNQIDYLLGLHANMNSDCNFCSVSYVQAFAETSFDFSETHKQNSHSYKYRILFVLRHLSIILAGTFSLLRVPQYREMFGQAFRLPTIDWKLKPEEQVF